MGSRPAPFRTVSASSDLLSAGATVLLDEHGSDFTVAGVFQTFTGAFNEDMLLEAPSMMGERETKSATLKVSTDSNYVPKSGQRITVNSKTWKVTSFQATPALWVVNLQGENQ